MAPDKQATVRSIPVVAIFPFLLALVSSLAIVRYVLDLCDTYRLFDANSVVMPAVWTRAGLRIRWEYARTPKGHISFRCIPLLFRVGQYIRLSMTHGEDIGARVRYRSFLESNGAVTFSLESYSRIWNGNEQRYGRQPNLTEIHAYGGYKAVADLCISPLDYATREAWAKRARLYQRYIKGRHHVRITGSFQEPVNSDSGRGFVRRQLHDEEAIVCNDGYSRFFRPDDFTSPRNALIADEELVDLDQNELACLACNVGAFVLSLKSWGLIRVDLMTPFEPDASIVDRLVIDENQRILLRHLALGQRELPASRQRIADEPGRLLLFSGKPGTGKTSLAKACAALCRRPLITLSGAELARSTSSAESTISDYSVSARALGAQILIEDVELCLEGTGGHHGPGNPSLAGVAKIAAVVEELTAGGSLTYLTTRRPHMLDPALFGDILLSVKLGEPEGDARRRMWSQALERIGVTVHLAALTNGMLKGAEAKTGISLRELDSLLTAQAGTELTPRSIYETVTAAQAIAGADDVDIAHIERALKASKRGIDDLRQMVEHHAGDRGFYM